MHVANILYVGNLDFDFKQQLSALLSKAGHNLTVAEAGKLQQATFGAVVLDWKSRLDQKSIEAGKTLSLPVIVISSQLLDALDAGEPFADIYLEHPADAKEVVALVIEMVNAPKLSLAHGANA